MPCRPARSASADEQKGQHKRASLNENGSRHHRGWPMSMPSSLLCFCAQIQIEARGGAVLLKTSSRRVLCHMPCHPARSASALHMIESRSRRCASRPQQQRQPRYAPLQPALPTEQKPCQFGKLWRTSATHLSQLSQLEAQSAGALRCGRQLVALLHSGHSRHSRQSAQRAQQVGWAQQAQQAVAGADDMAWLSSDAV